MTKNALRTIGIITTSRADYGIYTPILKALKAADDLEYGLYVSGTHLSHDHGYTVSHIEADGHPIFDRIDMITASDNPADIARAIGVTTQKFGDSFAKSAPDMLLVLGDRYEMLGAALAAVPFGIPIAHVHGGEVSEGAIDDVFRHSLTKMSHLHFPATELSARRIIQMGENSDHVITAGAPSLDNLNAIDYMSRVDLSAQFRLPENDAYMLATYHPVTMEYDQTGVQIKNMLAAIKQSGIFTFFTAANADTNGQIINAEIQKFVNENPEKSAFVETMGLRGYFSAMKYASAIIGNSSSGIIEAASFGVPVINIGNRQKGREQSDNIMNCGYDISEINEAIEKAFKDDFIALSKRAKNVYGQQNAVDIIINTMRSVNIKKILHKSFCLRE